MWPHLVCQILVLITLWRHPGDAWHLRIYLLDKIASMKSWRSKRRLWNSLRWPIHAINSVDNAYLIALLNFVEIFVLFSEQNLLNLMNFVNFWNIVITIIYYHYYYHHFCYISILSYRFCLIAADFVWESGGKPTTYGKT